MFDYLFFKRIITQHKLRFSNKSFIREEIFSRLLDKLSFIKLNSVHILVEGFDVDQIDAIKLLYPTAKISDNLSLYATYDVIISHLKIHQVSSINTLLKHWYNHLNFDGTVIFTSFGKNSLQEVRQAWQPVDNLPHINQMFDFHDVGDLLVKERYHNVVMDSEKLTLKYGNMDKLIDDIRALNEPLADTKMRKTFIGKRRWKSFCENLRRRAFSINYEVFYGYACKVVTYSEHQSNKNEFMVNINQIKRKKYKANN